VSIVCHEEEAAMRTTLTIGIALFLSISFQTTECLCKPESAVSPEKPSMHQRIYSFQHRLLPKWTHESKGVFFDDLMQGNTGKLMEAAAKMVGEDFSKKIEIWKYPEAKGVLLVFPTPNETLECFFIYIVKTKDGFRFYTYEKTSDLFGDGDKGVVGEWTANGRHNNFDSRKYDDVESFVTELQKSP